MTDESKKPEQEETNPLREAEELRHELEKLAESVNKAINADSWDIESQVVMNRLQVANNKTTQIALLRIMADLDKVLRYLVVSVETEIPNDDGGVVLN